ncbi:DUF4917 family protein [Flavobacterium sp. UMI-01]|uniref:DUF4917 family protein n=1 Tax=Flavobacterium sp. UMI-01 TaxID=1441053 RepID=UPI001C7DD903|nr:DUF4917 family protein [Flavobacterium sp. UMI-01]GIZ09025.1 hypothetical protein FUMI01_17520 [Flavobacterium sp. UMI-01]
MSLVKYSEMISEIKNTENHLLLGNGFNYSLGVNTGYANIFEVMKEHNPIYNNLIIENDNYDIEGIIGRLKSNIENSDKDFLHVFINNQVKKDFIRACFSIVKESIKNIYEEKNNGLGLLFKNFTNYFTLNYDPFLYLLLLKFKKNENLLVFNNTIPFKEIDLNVQTSEKYKTIKDIYHTYKKDIFDSGGNKILEKDFNKLTKTDFEKQLSDVLKNKGVKNYKKCLEVLYQELLENEIKLDISDGFTKNSMLQLFEYRPEINKNLFFLHGAFHLYKDKKSIYKITKANEKALYEIIDEILDNESKDLICVFTNDSKIDEINDSRYLKDSLDEFSNLRGNIVIIGSSLDNNDKHIFDAINDSEANRVYISSSQKSFEKDFQRATELFKNKEIVLFDRDTICYDKVEVSE